MKNPSGEYTISPSVLHMLVEQGPDAILELFRVMMNEAMKAERSGYLKAQPYERSEERLDYANGFKGRSITTGIGKVDLSIPQTRESGFYPKSLEAGTRSEKALRLALAEMYVQGVSTRKVTENAGKDGSVIVENVRQAQAKAKKHTIGYNVLTDEYMDMVKGGVIDPAKVTRGALENAASIAAMILTTEALITDVPEKDKPAAAPQMPEY